ncbi:hypothetical protein WOLCODRAFT_24710, partial [Wolfiporia cocos MD-104 SS10]
MKCDAKHSGHAACGYNFQLQDLRPGWSTSRLASNERAGSSPGVVLPCEQPACIYEILTSKRALPVVMTGKPGRANPALGIHYGQDQSGTRTLHPMAGVQGAEVRHRRHCRLGHEIWRFRACLKSPPEELKGII